MGIPKVAYAPVLPPGRHRMTLPEIKHIFVEGFPLSSSRPRILSEVERLISFIQSTSLVCELWLNGSFTTEKEHPDDIDISVAFWDADASAIDQTNFDMINLLLNGGKKFSGDLDTYLCPCFSREDTRYPADMTNYWADKWGKGWDDWLKGFVVIGIGETNVQRQLASR